MHTLWAASVGGTLVMFVWASPSSYHENPRYTDELKALWLVSSVSPRFAEVNLASEHTCHGSLVPRPLLEKSRRVRVSSIFPKGFYVRDYGYGTKHQLNSVEMYIIQEYGPIRTITRIWPNQNHYIICWTGLTSHIDWTLGGYCGIYSDLHVEETGPLTNKKNHQIVFEVCTQTLSIS